MLLVFDAPVVAHDGGEPLSIWGRTQEIAALSAGLVPDESDGLPRSTAWRPAPSVSVQPVKLTAQRIAADFDPAVVLLHCFCENVFTIFC